MALAISGYTARYWQTALAEAACANELLNALNNSVLNSPNYQTLTTAGAGTWTGALIAGGIIYRSGPTGNFTDTVDTAANIISAVGNSAQVQANNGWLLFFVNTTAFQATIAGASGVTIGGNATPVPANTTAIFWVSYAAAGAITMNCIASFYNSVSGYDPSSVQTQFGSGTGTFLEEGNLARAAYLSAGAINPATTVADNVLAVYTLPANSFDGTGQRGLCITASGLFGATANAGKRAKINFNPSTAVVGSTVGSGGTVIADTTATTASGLGWQLITNVFKVGAANSNTQYAQQAAAVIGATHGGVGVPVYPTATENAVIYIAVTGSATTALTDVALNFFEVNAMN